MATDAESIRLYFSKLDLEPEIADIYLALHIYGPQTLSELARRSGIERTRIYRLLDSLTASSLIEIEQQYKRSVLHAAPLTNLQVLISQKEQEVRDLQTELADVDRVLRDMALSTSATRVQFYRGPEGIKQMMWNQTKSQSENLSILYENMQSRVKLSFFERWVRACNEKGLTFRGIVSDNFIKTQQAWYGTYANERLASWQSRYVAGNVFEIMHSTVMYDDTIAYYNWKGNEIFGIEITNAEIAKAQRQFFEMLWAKSVDVDDLKGPSDKR